MTRPVHADPRMATILDVWNIKRDAPAARAARLLFDDAAQMQAFFQDAFPKSSVLAESGSFYGQGSNGHGVFDGILAMTSLDTMKAKRVDLPAAGYLIYAEDAHYMGLASTEWSGPGIDILHADRAREFLRRFRGRTADELRRAFGRESWRDREMSDWVAGCFDAGLPIDFIEALAWTERSRHYIESWSPELLGELHGQGVPVGYILHFWDRPAVFDKLWADRIPFDYAMEIDHA